MVALWDLVSTEKSLDCNVWSFLVWLTTISELRSLSWRVFRTISDVGLTSSPSILPFDQRPATSPSPHPNLSRSPVFEASDIPDGALVRPGLKVQVRNDQVIMDGLEVIGKDVSICHVFSSPPMRGVGAGST